MFYKVFTGEWFFDAIYIPFTHNVANIRVPHTSADYHCDYV